MQGILRGLGAAGLALALGGVARAQPPTDPPPAPSDPAAAPAAPAAPAAAPPPAETPAAPVALAAPAAAPAPPVETVAAAPDPQPPRPDDAADPWARPHFVKGELSSFSTRPLTRRNFIGVGAGISAIPTNADTLLNAFYFTVEPQVDIVNARYNWRLGLGAPLQFELADTRGPFELCVGEGRQARTAGAGQDEVAARSATCVAGQKNRVTENFGQLRKADWDEASDFAKVIRYMVIGGQEQPFYLSLSRLYDQSFGHGTVVRDYNANLDYNTARLGATLDFNRSAVGVQAMANDLVSPDLVGVMGFVRPWRPYSDDVFWRSVSFGVSYVHGSNLPRVLLYEPGLFTPAFDEPIPRVNQELDLVGGQFRGASIVGADVEAKVLRTRTADLKLYLDYQKMLSYGGGATVGSLWRFSFGEPATRALRARAEVHYFDPDYLPSFFDTYHDIFQYQYLPIAYGASNGLTYYPTKLGYLDASKGGRNRVGAYVELSHAFLDYLTLGVAARTWSPVGSPKEPGFVGPTFPDYGADCTSKDGQLECSKRVGLGKEPGFTSVRFHAEIPLRRFLQAFASYEVFSTTRENGLGLFRFDGDNELFFTGARLMLLPVFFIQAEARRYFFLQRLTNVDLDALTLQQDQNYHANWTFAVNAFVGYEF